MTLVTKVDYSSSENAHKTGRSLGRALSEGLTSKGKTKRESLPRGGRGRRDDGILPVITVKKVDGSGNPVPGNETGRFVFDGFIFHLEEKVRRYRPAVNMTGLIEGHAFSAAMTDQEKAEQLGLYISEHMSGKRTRSFGEALGMADVQRVLSRMYDMSTHTYEADGQVIRFRSLETDEIDNPLGPAVVDMTDFRRIVSHPAPPRHDLWESLEYDEEDIPTDREDQYGVALAM